MENPSFISVYEGIATNQYCQKMIDAWEYIHNTSSSIGGEYKGEVVNKSSINRKDSAYFFDIENKDMATETYKILDTALALYVDEHPSLGDYHLVSTNVKVQKTKPKGGFHVWHCEQKGLRDSLRQLTWTIYLNDIQDGEGETEYLEYGVKIKPKRGDICTFPASWTHTHRGNPVYTKEKYIATGWWYGSENDMY